MPRDESATALVPTLEYKPWEVWSCGGGVQSAAVAALIVSGRLPKPDFAVMVDTERERQSTWRYVDGVLKPALESAGVTLHVIKKSTYAKVDLWGGEDGGSCLIPGFTDQTGEVGKLPEFCSNEWKQRCVMRWCAAMGLKGSKAGVKCWLGISTDEQRRRRGPQRQWFQPWYPLLDAVPMGRSGCFEVVRQIGWPDPPRSCCWMCPNMQDAQWLDMKENDPADFAKAVELEREVRKRDPHLWLHERAMPLDVIEFRPESPGLFGNPGGGCSSGMCY